MCSRLSEPQVASRARCNGGRPTSLRNTILGDRTTGDDTRDLNGIDFSEPEIAIGTTCDTSRATSKRRNREFGDLASRIKTPDPVCLNLHKPQVAVRAGRNVSEDRAVRERIEAD